MLTAALIALTLVLGPHPLYAAVLALAILQPVWFLAAVALWAAWSARRRQQVRARLPGLEADLLRGMAAELEAGASIREALMLGQARAPSLNLDLAVRYARAGRPAAEVAGHLRSTLHFNGSLVGAAYQIVSDTGARAAGVFTSLAVRAAERGELERERRTLTAQARLSAWLVGGLPVAGTVLLAATGRGPQLTGVGGLLAAVGAFLIALGGLAVWLLVRDQ